MEVLNNKDEIIDKISSETGMPREKIQEKIQEKVKEYSGLLTEAGAAFSVAKELGVDIPISSKRTNWVRVKDINKDLGFVSVVGVVKTVSKVNDWSSADKTGKVAHIHVDDGTGEIRVTLWNQDAELVEAGKIKVGSTIGIKNAIIKEGRAGLELSLGMRGKIIMDPRPDFDIPQFTENIVGISSLSDGMEGVSLFGRVIRKFNKTTFKRKDGTESKRASFVIGDGNTTVRVVLWGSAADYIDDISIGSVVKLENVKVRENQGSNEIHVGWDSRIVINPPNPPNIPDVFPAKQISNLDEGNAKIRATVVKVYPPTEIKVCPVCGAVVEDVCPEHNQARKTYIVNVELDDGTGVIRGVMFRGIAEKFIGENVDSRLGEELIFYGKVKSNDLFDRKEFIVQDFEYPKFER